MSEMDLQRLFDEFPPEVIHWRIGATTANKDRGMALAYIDARDVMDRLDGVCGSENWQCEYSDAGGGKMACRIGILVNEHWVWKADGAGETDVEGAKGAFSDAFKRAAVKWGIGRYLYDLDSPWVEIEQKGRSSQIKPHEYARLSQILGKQSQQEFEPHKFDLDSATQSIKSAKDLDTLERFWKANYRYMQEDLTEAEFKKLIKAKDQRKAVLFDMEAAKNAH